MKYQHTETDRQRITAVDLSERGKDKIEQLRRQYESKGIRVVVKDSKGVDQEFYAIDFQTISDHAGDPLLHIKFKKDLVLYLTTPHLCSMKCLEDFRIAVRMFAPQNTEIRDFMIDIKEMIETAEKGTKGYKDGVHPEMGYVREVDDAEKKTR